MAHERWQRQLSAYLDGELGAEETREVRAHLAACPLCSGELERLAAVKRLLGALPEHPAPEALWSSVRARLGQPAAATAPWLQAARNLFRRPAAAAAALALVVILIAVPLVKGRIDRLRAAEIGVDLFVREHALISAGDPFADRAYLGLLVADANLVLSGGDRHAEERR